MNWQERFIYMSGTLNCSHSLNWNTFIETAWKYDFFFVTGGWQKRQLLSKNESLPLASLWQCPRPLSFRWSNPGPGTRPSTPWPRPWVLILLWNCVGPHPRAWGATSWCLCLRKRTVSTGETERCALNHRLNLAGFWGSFIFITLFLCFPIFIVKKAHKSCRIFNNDAFH